MKFAESDVTKADQPLRDALRQAGPGDRVRAVIVLDPSRPVPVRATNRNELASQIVDGAATRSAGTSYRAGLIQQQRERLKSEIGPVLNSLKGLSLDVSGGDLSKVVVAEGPAEKIMAGLKIPGVRSATLDRAVTIDQPRRRS